MSLITERYEAGKLQSACCNCHRQQLEALSPENFDKHQRGSADEGWWKVTVNVPRCRACYPNVFSYVSEAFLNTIGVDYSTTVELCFTYEQMRALSASAAVGAVAGAPDRVQNGNIQLANARVNPERKKDQLYSQALFEIWPWVASLMATDDTSLQARICSPHTMLCGAKSGTLRNREWIPNPKALLNKTTAICPSVMATLKLGTCAWAYLANCTPVYDPANVTKEDKNVLAVKYGPTSRDSVFYESTPDNAQKAIKERIVDKYVPFNMTDDDRVELSRVTEQMVQEVLHSNAPERICEWLLFGDYKSNKWAKERQEMRINILMWTYLPHYQFTAAIKLEPMPDGKPPRMIIADGDSGAVMSSMIIGVMELYYTRYYKHQNIKGCSKSKRMYDICNSARERDPTCRGTYTGAPTGSTAGGMIYMKGFMLENDGSAWDTCCSQILRDLTENRLFDAFFEKLKHFVVPLNQFYQPRRMANLAKNLKLSVSCKKVNLCNEMSKTVNMGSSAWSQTKQNSTTQDDAELEQARQVLKKSTFKVIDSIRRSGDRGTSLFNWIINRICWAWVIAGSDADAINAVNGKCFTDIFGNRRRFKWWFEGDDSLIWLTGPEFTEKQMDELAARWTKLGHRPKLYQRTEGQVAEFCGWKVVVDAHGLDVTTAVPDVPRLLNNCFYTTSKVAIAFAMNDIWRIPNYTEWYSHLDDGQKRTAFLAAFGREIAPAIIAKASSIADRVPTIATWLLKCADEVMPKNLGDEVFTRDELFRMPEGHFRELLPEWWDVDDPDSILDQRWENFVDIVRRKVSNSIANDGVALEAKLALKHQWVKSTTGWNTFCEALDHVTLSTSDEDFRAILPKGMGGNLVEGWY